MNKRHWRIELGKGNWETTSEHNKEVIGHVGHALAQLCHLQAHQKPS
jgi:hypothetical protein